jgi:hypothetical protein
VEIGDLPLTSERVVILRAEKGLGIELKGQGVTSYYYVSSRNNGSKGKEEDQEESCIKSLKLRSAGFSAYLRRGAGTRI